MLSLANFRRFGLCVAVSARHLALLFFLSGVLARPVLAQPAGQQGGQPEDGPAADAGMEQGADNDADAAKNPDTAENPGNPDDAFPPVEPIDPQLLAPLPPLAGFDAAPAEAIEVDETPASGLRYRVTVEGIAKTGAEDSFRHLSALYEGDKHPATAAQIASRTNADRELLQRLLQAEGWYAADVESALHPSADGEMDVGITVDPGVRFRWSTVTLDLIPDDRPDLSAGFGLKAGDPIRAEAVEQAEGALLLKLQENGFPFAEIGARDIVLADEDPTASYFLTGDIGEEGVFGPVRIDGYRPFSARHAAIIARFHPGDPYDARLVDDLRRALIETQQFGGVTVAPVNSGEHDADGRAIAAIEIHGNEGPKRLLAGQFGYASREGIRAEATWRHRSLIQPEGMFTARAIAGTQEQRLTSDLLLGNWGQRDRSLEFSAGVANLTPPAYHAQTLDLQATLARISTPIWQKRWTWSVGAALGLSHERPKTAAPLPPDEDVAHRTFLFATTPLQLSYDHSDDLLDPAKGFRLRLELDPELSRQTSGGAISTYVRAFLGGSFYQKLGDSFVLATMVRGGSIVGAGLDNISLTRRLYAGGGGSVRGYRYQGLGLHGTDDSPVGGRGLFEGSIEGRYRLGTQGIVAFLDGGSVAPGSLPSFSHVRFGAGLGWRYYTSFGPIRIDVARAIQRRPIDPKIAIYVSIGQAF